MNSAAEPTATAARTDTTNHLPATNACAACKFQRRKCSTDCPLAPYFPANRIQDFQNVRRLFGVRNVLKTLADVDQSERFAAAECMIFEANCRAKDPSGGCYRLIASLQRELMLLEAQRQHVLFMLRVYRPVTATAESTGGGPVATGICGKANLCSSVLVDSGESGSDFDDRFFKKKNLVDFDLQDRHQGFGSS